MKKIITLVILLFSLAYGIAQSPQKMSFQAVIRNNTNTLLSNQSVGIKISILQGSSTGTVVYSETQITTTNANGLITIQIGGGTVVSGNFTTIAWENGPYFIETKTDVTGGTNYTLTSTTQLLSVPYAFYSQTSGSSIPGPQGIAGNNGLDGKNSLVKTSNEPAGMNCTNGGTKIEIGLDVNNNGILESNEVTINLTQYVCNGANLNINGTNQGDMLYWNGTSWSIIPPGLTGQTLTYCDGIPKWGTCGVSLPIVQTGIANSITNSSITASGNVISDGGSAIIQKGICYSSNSNPTISDNIVNNGTGTGNFTSSLNNLFPNSTYYLRAFATNSLGTSYGNEITFTTASLTVGQTYQGGIIAYIFQTTDPGYIVNEVHGIIAATNDIGFSEWGCKGTSVNTSFNLGSGLSNTNLIINTCGQSSIAAKICKNYNVGGYNDWFLPSREDLRKLYLNRNSIGGFITSYGVGSCSACNKYGYYYSSSQDNSDAAWGLDFSSGNTIGYTSYQRKDNLYLVRPIRYF